MENLEIYLDYIGDDSYVYRYNYDNKKYYNTGICLKGNPGNPGRPGKDGKTPHIGTNGDWYIGDVDTGVKAYTRTEVVTQLPEPSETTKNQIYVAPALNPQEGDSYSEYVTVYKDGQYKWELLGTKIATMGASGNNHKGGLVPDTPSTAGTTKFLCEDGTWKVIDISGKEDVTTIVAPVNETDATLPITTLTTEIGKYYRIDVPIETLGITLPAMDTVTSVKKVDIYFTAGTTPAVTISAADNKSVAFQNDYEIEAGKTYEVNALFNGIAWVVTAVEIFVPEPEPITIVYKGDNASATNIMTKTINAFGDTYTLDEASITKMTLDDNKVTLTDFNIANLGQYGRTCDVYTYTFNDANEHTLKVWTNSSDMFRLSPWVGGPSPSQSAYFSSIKSVVIPNTITTIGSNAFHGCSGLTSITIPNSVTSIGNQAFQDCTGLTSVTIGDGVTSIGGGAFSHCTSVSDFTVGSNVAVGMLSGNTSLTSVTIGSGVTSISGGAFWDCTSLTSIDIPNSVTSIDYYAFRSCTSLTSVTIGSGVTSISDTAFDGCTGLTNIVVDSANTVYDSRDNCNAIINTSTNELITGCKNTVIPNTVTSIGNMAFMSCSGLTSITIPNSVTSIGEGAFWGCSGLTSITIPNSVTSIGTDAFQWCSGLTSITIPGSVTSIGNSAFGSCAGLTSVTIGSGVTSIGMSAFRDCTGLTSITIPDSVTSIGEGAFSDCSSLTSVTIGNSVTSIDMSAFRNCSGLTSIICNAMTAPTIQSSTFQNVKTGGTLTVPSGSSGYDVWMRTGNYYLGKYNWTKVEQ